jgi:hypothetical protein
VILLTGVGCATGAVIQKVFFENTIGMTDVVEGGLVHAVNQSQTIDGVTVTVHSAYADARRLMFGIGVLGGKDAHHFIQVESSIINGTKARGLHITGQDSSFNLFDDEENANQEERFSYEVRLVEDVSPEVAELTRIRSGGDPTMINVQLELWVEDAQSDTRSTLAGPFRFSFDMPIQPAHRLELHQTSRDAGVAATLEDVIITPSLMQTRICFDPDDSDNRWNAEITAARPDGLRIQSQAGVQLNAGCIISILYGVEIDPSGAWTLTIDELKSETKTIDGSWTFEFEVPESNP